MRSNSAYVLSRTPLIVAGSFGLLEELPPGPDITVLYHLPWWLHPAAVIKMRARVRKLQKRRRARVIICTNERRETWFARAGGLVASWHNHNIHVREACFKPSDAAREIKYDAIYAATLDRYKRLALAAGIESLYVLTYKRGESSGWNLHAEYPSLGHAQYNRCFLPEADVNALYGSSNCGLALSRWEGAMYSSMEYLMAGLPMVSTRSSGGRDQFRDDYYWRTVAASPDAVAAGVRAWRKNPPDRQEVRRRVLAKVEEARSRFAQFVVRTGSLGETAAAFQHRVWGGPEGITKIRVCPSQLTGS